MAEPRMTPVEGARLTRVGRELWCADRELILPTGVRLPIRMMVLRGACGRLLCYSPVGMDDGTLEALDGLGEVTWLIAPNRLHGAFFEAARRRFPRARVLSCRDGEGDRLAGEGSLGGIADYHVVRGSRRFSEIVLYHDAAETLMLSDLILNVSSAEPRLKWLLKLNGAWAQPAQGRVQRWGYLRDRRALSVFYRWAMARPFRQISVSHGGIIRDGAREVIYRLFRPTVSASLRQSR